jgi:outer membrane murein-binding lipoprotein Lpp
MHCVNADQEKGRSKRSMPQVHGLEAIMRSILGDDEDKINNLTSDLEDLKTTVEELQDDPPTNVDAESLQAVKAALQQASDATDEIEDQQEESANSDTNS